MIELRPAKYLLGRLAPMDNNDKIPQFNLGAGTYDSTVYLRGDGVWANPLAGAGFVPLTRELTINGVTYDLSANRTWIIDKVSVGLGNVDNTSDANKPISTATQTALNSKQNNITLTTTGTSGASTLVGSTLNIPQYSQNLSGYVPYVGATANVNLGEFGISSGWIRLDTSPTTYVAGTGGISWNSTDGTADLELLNGVTLQIGQELHFYAKATEIIPNGSAVMFAGVQGNHLLIAKAERTLLNANPNYFMGVATQDFINNEFGYVTAFGKVRGLNTTAYSLGAVLYYDSTSATPGLLTATMPNANLAKIEVAAVVRVHANQGIIMVRPHVMPMLNEIQDVNTNLSKTTPVDADSVLLQDNADSNIWKKLSWLNTKATLKSYFDTLYQVVGSYVPTSRTITINGTNQDLSANRTYNVGTVTSVGVSAPTGFSVSNSPVTNSGTIGISFASGYSLPTNASQSNWNEAYNDKINSVSVTGTTVKLLTLTQQDGGTLTTSWTDINTDAVSSVFGRTGAVVAVSGDYNTSQVTENTNLYYTEARVNANANVAANTAARHNAVTLGTANGLSLSTQQLSLGLSSGSTTGALSSTDWNTFNNKQNALTNPVTGAGTTNRVPKFTGATTIGDSIIFDNGTNVGINTTSPGIYPYAAEFNVNGSISSSGGKIGWGVTDAFTSYGYSAAQYGISYNLASASPITVSGYYGIGFFSDFSERMRVAFNGNVGIGTTNPSGLWSGTNRTLEITGGTNTSSELRQSRPGATITRFLSGTSDEFGVFTNSALNYTIYTNGSERMRIAAGGNIGIGTTNPSKKLSVSNGGAQGIEFGINTSGEITAYNRAVSAYIPLNFDASLYSFSVGNVGIGTTNPSSKFHVLGASTDNVGLAYFENNHSAGGLYYPAAQFVNSYGNHSFGIVAGFKMGNLGGPDRPSILFYNDTAAKSWQIGQISAGWGSDDDFGIGYRASNDPNSFGTWPTNYFTITSAGNIGINTTSPDDKLDVEGYIRMSGTTSASGILGGTTASWGGNSQYPTLYSTDVTRWIMLINPHISYTQNGTNGYSGAMNGSSIRFASDTSATTFWDLGVGVNSVGTDKYSIGRAGTSLLAINNTGNVGIGTTAPSNKFVVSDNGGLGLEFNPNYLGETYIAGYNRSSSSYINLNFEAANLVFRTGGGATIGMYINSSQNVGIGTTNPSEKLTVQGNIYASQGGLIAYRTDGGTGLDVNGGDFGPGSFIARFKDYSNSDQVVIKGDGTVGIGTTTPSAKLTLNGDMRFESPSNVSTITFPNGPQIQANAPAGFFRSGNVYTGTGGPLFNNVGINKTSPTQTLDVAGVIRAESVIRIEGTHSTTRYENILPAAANGAGTGIAQMSWWVSEPGISWTSAGFGYNVTNNGASPYGFGRINNSLGQAYMRFIETGNLHFYNADTSGNRVETMTLVNTGRVGINTTTPSSLLHLSGTTTLLTITDTSYGRTSEIGYLDNANLYFANDGASNTYIGRYNNVFLAYGGGSVGIGTTNPNAKLDVNGTIRSSQYLAITNVFDGRGLYADDSVGSTIFSLTRQPGNEVRLQGFGPLTFYTNGNTGSERMRITDSGNVGIGTTSPAAKLHVNGTVLTTSTLNSTAGSYTIDHPGVNTWKIGITNTNTSTLHIGNDIGGSFVNKVLNITNAGNVGIGTTSPGCALEVNGNVGIGIGGTIEPSAALEVKSNTQGFLPPRMNNSEINAISNPAEGLIVYSTESRCLFLFDGAGWQKIAYA